MRIISEKTGKEYASVEECIAAEKEFDEAVNAALNTGIPPDDLKKRIDETDSSRKES